MNEIYQDGCQPFFGASMPVQRVHTAAGPVYVPVSSELHASQPIRREITRVIRRQVQTEDGRFGIELTEERDIVYAPARASLRREHDPVRVGLAGIVAFLAVCILFTMLGGGDQSAGLIPLYWGGFFTLWWALS